MKITGKSARLLQAAPGQVAGLQVARWESHEVAARRHHGHVSRMSRVPGGGAGARAARPGVLPAFFFLRRRPLQDQLRMLPSTCCHCHSDLLRHPPARATTLLACPRTQGVIVVPQQQVYVMERFGKFSEVLYAGIHLRLPGVFRIAYGAPSTSLKPHHCSNQGLTGPDICAHSSRVSMCHGIIGACAVIVMTLTCACV